MNESFKVEAYRSFYEQGMVAFDSGDIKRAREFLLKASELANEVSNKSNSYDIRIEYHNIALRILEFVKKKCVEKTINNTSAIQTEKNNTINSSFQPIKKDEIITFDDVAGLKDVKEEIEFKVLNPIKNPDLAKKYKISAGGKILLYGPPGTGKTFIAKAIAGEVDAEFYSINCQDLISKYMGDSSKQLQNLFDTATRNEKSIIFFDEFDSVASKRGNDGNGVDAEMARFVATFLTLVDGFKKTKTNKMLLLIAATNRPWVIDNAMLRGGRFDTQIYVSLPDKEARDFLVKKAFSEVPIADDIDFNILSNLFEGFGGGDIVSICSKIRLEAYKKAVRNNCDERITMFDCEKIIKKQKNIITKEELERFELYQKGEL